MKSAAEVKASPAKRPINSTFLIQMIKQKKLDVFRKLFEFDDGELTPQERATRFLDALKTYSLKENGKSSPVLEGQPAAPPKDVSVLEFSTQQGSANIVNFILEQINLVDPTRIGEFVPDIAADNPIGENDAISRDKDIKVNLLMMAIKLKNSRTVASLVAQLIEDIDADSYRKCMQMAIEIGDFTLLSSLLHSRIFERLQNELRPLHMLCDATQDYAVLVERFSAGLNLNLADPDGNTPLHLAVRRKHKYTVGKIAQFTNLNCKNSDALTPIQVAAKQCDFEIVKLLYQAGGDINRCITLVKQDIEREDVDTVKYAKSILLNQLTNLLTLHNPPKKPIGGEVPEEQADQDVKDLPPAMKYIYGCFKGGGGKGWAYLPAIKEAMKQLIIDLKQFKGFAGTSAGSITAALLALGLPIEELEKITNEKNFTEFFDYYDEALVNKIKSQLEGGVGIWKILTNYWTINSTKALMDDKLGFCKGDNFYEWIKGLIKKSIENTSLRDKFEHPEYVTFRDLHNHPEFKDLVVYGSNVNTGFSECYSFETTPDMCIADAIRISMSIPVIFSPHKKWIYNEKSGKREHPKKIIINKDGKREEVEDLDDCVDGGLFNNYPIGAFDYTETGEYRYNERTIGFCLVEPDEHEQFEYEQSRRGDASHEGSSIRYILSVIYSAMFNQQAVDHQKNSLDRNRTIYINTRDIKTTEFFLTEPRKEILTHEAEQGVIRFIARQNNLPEKNLSSEVVKKLFSMGIIFNDKGIFRLQGKKQITAARILKLYACADDGELDYLKTVVNPNFLENGVSALQIAKAYGYKKIEARLLQCNASPDGLELAVDEIKERLATDPLIDMKDESLLMKTKKRRLKEEIVSLSSQFRDDRSTLTSVNAQQRQELEERISSLERRLEDKERRSVRLSEVHQELINQKDIQLQALEDQKVQQQKQMTFFLCRYSHEKKLREKIVDLNKFKKQFVDAAAQLWGKKSAIEAAEKHWNLWRDSCTDVIVQHFLAQCPEHEVKSENEVQKAYCLSLRFLLIKLKSDEYLNKIIGNSSDEPDSYHSHILRYREEIVAHLKETEQGLVQAPQAFFASLPVQRQPLPSVAKPPTTGLFH